MAAMTEYLVSLLFLLVGHRGIQAYPETRFFSGAMENPARGQPCIWRCLARSQDHAGNARAHDHHAGRMECAHQPSAPAVLIEMDRDRPAPSMRDCSRSRKRLDPGERLGVNHGREILENSGQKVDMAATAF